MEKRERYKRLLIFAASVLIMSVQVGIYSYIWFHCYSNAGSNHFVRGNYVVIALYALMLFGFYKIYGGFKIGHKRVLEMLYTQILSVLCVNVVTYFQLSLIGRWAFLTNLTPILQMTAVDIIVVIIWVAFTRWIYVHVFPPRKLLVVYGPYSPDNLIRKLESRKDKYIVQETISIDRNIDEIKEKIRIYRNVILSDIPAEVRNNLLKYCYAENIRCYSVPKISDIMIMSAEDIHLFDTSLLLFRNMGLTAEQQFIKRIMDIVVSLLLIIVTSPFLILIALCIKFYDRGPVFFTQDRLTKDGRVFKLYKFRSMYVDNGEKQYRMTRKNDERITPVGKVIRNIHFDELPQIFNILKGDMSFVGPRPECPPLAAEYCKMIPEFDFRLKVKAGLTGFAQVYGKYNTTPYDKLKLDLTYIENYSFFMDIKIIMLTFKILFQKENTEGIESWQHSAATRENLEKLKKDDE